MPAIILGGRGEGGLVV